MSAVQTTYSERIEKGYAGQIADETNCNVDSKTVETVAGIGFGLAVTKGTADNGVVQGGAVAGFVGVTVRDPSLLASDTDIYPRYANAGVLSEGDIWVTTKNIVVGGGAVYYDSSTGLWDDASGGNVGPVKGASFMTSAASGALAIVRFTGSVNNA
jgi:hypothetical protein